MSTSCSRRSTSCSGRMSTTCGSCRRAWVAAAAAGRAGRSQGAGAGRSQLLRPTRRCLGAAIAPLGRRSPGLFHFGTAGYAAVPHPGPGRLQEVQPPGGPGRPLLPLPLQNGAESGCRAAAQRVSWVGSRWAPHPLLRLAAAASPSPTWCVLRRAAGLCQVTKLTATLKRLDARDATRIELTDQLLNK